MEILREKYAIEPGSIDLFPSFFDLSRAFIFKYKSNKYIIKQYKKYHDATRFNQEHLIFDYLYHAGFPVPKLIPSREGLTFVSRHNRHYAVFEFLEGYRPLHSYYFLSSRSSHILGKAGKCLGQMHALLGGFRTRVENA